MENPKDIQEKINEFGFKYSKGESLLSIVSAMFDYMTDEERVELMERYDVNVGCKNANML